MSILRQGFTRINRYISSVEEIERDRSANKKTIDAEYQDYERAHFWLLLAWANTYDGDIHEQEALYRDIVGREQSPERISRIRKK